MATTAVFAEILIIGLQALVWIALIAIAVVWPSRLPLYALEGWQSLATIAALVVAYSLGILVDRASDTLLEPIERTLARRYLGAGTSASAALGEEPVTRRRARKQKGDGLSNYTTMRLQIAMESQPVEKLLDYARSRLRIARATTVNLALVIATAILLLLTRPVLTGADRARAIASLLLLGVPLVILSYYAWHRISRIYYRRVGRAYEMIMAERPATRRVLDEFVERLNALHADAAAALDVLPQAALDWSPGPEMNSLSVLAAHIEGSERYWIGHVAGQEPSDRDRDAEFRTQGISAAALAESLDEVLADSRRVLERLSPADLGEKRQSARHPDREYTSAWAILHSLEHTAMHVGHMQIVRQLWDQREAGG